MLVRCIERVRCCWRFLLVVVVVAHQLLLLLSGDE